MPKSFLDILNEKIIVFDGAMGTNIQAQGLSVDDFGGEQYNGCNERLVITKPAAIEKVHSDFFEVGCDVIETDTFGGTSIVLSEYGLEDQAYTLNHEAVCLAKRIASQYSSSAHIRFVAGSMGPTTKLPSLGHISFREMAKAYHEQAAGLVEGGVDLLVVETCQDILQAKAALAGIFSYFKDTRKRLPVIVSVTVEPTGTMLLGTEIAAALTSLEPYDVDVIGVNCATGPKEMSEHIRYLCANSPKPVFVMPNAGMPENVGGRAHYHLAPEEFVYYQSRFVKDLGVSVVGGCCGTTKEHLRALVEAVGGLSPRSRSWDFTPGCSSIYQTVPFHIDPAPVMVGERTNANGSKMFRELLAAEDWEGMVAMGREQVKEGAHILDVCLAYVGRDEVSDAKEFISRLNTQVAAPLMIDSTEPTVIEEALQRIGGRAIVNSINLEDGEERAGKILQLCRKYGAAVVALTIDQRGMAKTAKDKLEIAERIHRLATKKYGMRQHDLVFDALTFTLASGDEAFRRAGIETLEAIRLIKKEFPQAHTSLGVSNVSFGLAPNIRSVLNSVFLHHAVEHGLDIAIVHASKIMPLYKIGEVERELSRKLIFDERADGFDPLQALIEHFEQERKTVAVKKVEETEAVEERLKKRIVEGDRAGLTADLDEALKSHKPLEIINAILLDGMRIVGDLFGSGKMQLPFVLQSAEVMKAAVSYLEPFMEKSDVVAKGTMVIATVKGDVHDIGKNLVDIILTNNGYKVHNLGIKCPAETMLHAAEELDADAIGMSGLLVKSTLVMKENLEVMNERGISIPVVLGGAALTRRYVEEDLRKVYGGTVAYATDAFDGLRFMEDVMRKKSTEPPPHPTQTRLTAADEDDLAGYEAKIAISLKPEAADIGTRVRAVERIPIAPFFGTKTVEDISLDDVFPFVNENALFRGQWHVRKGEMSDEDHRSIVEEKVRPEFDRLKEKAMTDGLLSPKVVYGYFPCQSDGNDLIIYRPKDLTDVHSIWPDGLQTTICDQQSAISILSEWLRFTFPRQHKGRMLCISDFFASKKSARIDVVAFHLVTMGSVASEHSRKLFASNDYKQYLYFHGLSVEAAEALAEYWHRRIRIELEIDHDDARLPNTNVLDIKRLFSQGYRGSRYSFGYPACPSLEDHAKLFELLRPERIGVELTEEFQLVPEQSTDAVIVHHPEARYFVV